LNKKSNIKKSKALYRDILDILDFYSKKETIDVPLSVKNKLDCLKKISSMALDDKTIENIIDSILFSEKFKQHVDFLDVKMNEDLKEHDFQDIIKQVRLRKKINALFNNYDELSNVLDSIKDGSFDSIDDLVDDYESTIKKLYSNMMESNRAITLEAAASLDLAKDDYSHVLEMITKKYENRNTTSTGFSVFDAKDIMMGGYEPSRLYVFGGGSGAGKSTILNNTIYKSAIQPRNQLEYVPTPGKIDKAYIYVTMENTIEEALMRTYQPMFDRTTSEMLSDIKEGVDIKKRVNDELAKTGSTIIMKYFPAMSISTLDLMGVIDDVINTYGKKSIAGLYVDYLDLLKTDVKYDLYRLELGHITLSLKTLAVQYNIPVITASQLGRDVYKTTDAHTLGLGLMSESIKKVEHADFVMLIAKDPNEQNQVLGKIGKNRSGQSNISINFRVDFSRFKFITATKLANNKKADASNVNPDEYKFDGFNTL
jgi:replicative DNA helicase